METFVFTSVSLVKNIERWSIMILGTASPNIVRALKAHSNKILTFLIFYSLFYSNINSLARIKMRPFRLNWVKAEW